MMSAQMEVASDTLQIRTVEELSNNKCACIPKSPNLTRAELALHLSLPLEYGGPGVVEFECAGICTPSLKISPKVSRIYK
jgi:hypothetical protein